MVTTKKIYTQKEMIKDQDQLNTKEGSDGENEEGEVVSDWKQIAKWQK